MKKVFSMILVCIMVLGLAACGNTTGTAGGGNTEEASAGNSVSESSADDETPAAQGEDPSEPETVVVTGRDSAGEAIEVTVPYKPERVVVLDLANLDILDNLGLGGCIVGVPTITLLISSLIMTVFPSWALSRLLIWKQSWPVSRT
jgi:iron complex transport system substrate-binding protein